MASPESGPAAYMGPQVWMIRRVWGGLMVSKSLQVFIIPGFSWLNINGTSYSAVSFGQFADH